MSRTMQAQEVYDKLKISQQMLSRLVSDGTIKRLGRGVYSADDVESYWRKQHGIFIMADEERKTIIENQEVTAYEVFGENFEESLYINHLRKVLDSVSYEHLEIISEYTNYDVLRLIEQNRFEFRERLQAYIIAAMVAKKHPSLDLWSLDDLLERLSAPTVMLGEKSKKVIDLVLGTFSEYIYNLEQMLDMFDEATQYYMKVNEGTFRIKLLDDTHKTGKDVSRHNDKRDTYLRYSKINKTSALGARLSKNGRELDIDNGFVYDVEEHDFDRLLNVVIPENNLSSPRKEIADKLIEYYGIDLLKYIVVHAYGSTNRILSAWVDSGGSGKDFLTDVLTFSIKHTVVHEPNLSFANAGATSANPARAQRIFDGSRVVVLEEQTLKTFKNLWDVFIKAYVGQDGSNRVGKISVGAQAVPIFCSLIMHMNPNEDGHEHFSNQQINFVRRMHLIDLSRGGKQKISVDWKLLNSNYDESRWSSLHQKTMRMNELDFVWGAASNKDKENFSNYIIGAVFDSLNADYIFEIPERYKYKRKETPTVAELLEELNG